MLVLRTRSEPKTQLGDGMRVDDSDDIEGVYETVVSVDARSSGQYDDSAKIQMRQRLYRIVKGAFVAAGIHSGTLHQEDRGDGVLASVDGRVPPSRLLGLWLVELHELLRAENAGLSVPLGLRVGMHVGPVRHDAEGISGRAVDLACRLADTETARRLLEREQADLVLVASDSLYQDVVSHGGKFIEPARYASARERLKEGPTTAWFLLPGRPRPDLGELAQEPPRPPAPTRAATGGEESGSGGEESGGDSYQALGGDVTVNKENVYYDRVHIGRVVHSGPGSEREPDPASGRKGAGPHA